jgi:hypothetical protein
MIQANELRIGNYIYFENKIITVNYIAENHIGYGKGNFAPISFNDFAPIPLDENILVKCGFDYVTMGIFKASDKNFDFPIIKWSGEVARYTTYNVRGEVRTITELNYLHELQNLYWFLCKKELTIIL